MNLAHLASAIRFDQAGEDPAVLYLLMGSSKGILEDNGFYDCCPSKPEFVAHESWEIPFADRLPEPQGQNI
jgi:hypothetical protein